MQLEVLLSMLRSAAWISALPKKDLCTMILIAGSAGRPLYRISALSRAGGSLPGNN
jgi:hypothetical protein